MNIKELTIKEALDLAVKYHKENKLGEAEVLYKKILDKEPNNANALHLLGVIAYQRGKYGDSILHINKAIQLNPKVAFYYGNLGMAYDALGKEEDAAKYFMKALEINPRYEKAHLAYYNLGVYYMDRGKVKEALEHYDKAIELDKDFFEARWNRSLVLLLLGRFKEGWEEYEYRFKKKSPSDSRSFDKPKWDGSSLEGKRILILAEQGFGDNIQFIRYISFVKEKEGYVILECKKGLKRLFEDFLGVDEFIEKEGDVVPNVNFDFYIHLMSLPKVFNTDINTIPNKIPYLETDSNLVYKFRAEFDNDSFKVGIAWAGNPKQENDKNRSTKFEKFKILKEIEGIRIYSLQKGGASQQLNDNDVINIADKINDFADTAAIIENLDLIISVDTSIAHLAGAMGKPTWTLLSAAADWRWLLDRKDSPWYPTMKLFRQQRLGDWDSVFNDVAKELKNLIKNR